MKTKIITIPNILSLFRICLIPLFVWLYCAKANYQGTAAVLLVSGFTDVLDGFIARKFHMISDLGKVLDPIADKATQAAMLLCLITRFRLMIIPLILLIIKESYMGITGAMVIRKTGKVYGADWHGKAATCVLYAMMVLHVIWHNIPPFVSDALIAASVIMMLISLILYGIRNHRFLKNSEI